MKCSDNNKFVTAEASSKAKLRTIGAIDKFLNIRNLNLFRQKNTDWSNDAKERFGIVERLFAEDGSRAVPNKRAFKAIDSAKGINYQLEEVPASVASLATIAKVKEVAKKMGIDIQTLSDYLKGNPDVEVKGVNGLADLVRGIVAISEGKESGSLTEEMVHVATAMLEQTNPTMITEMISKIDRFAIYKVVLNAYKDNKSYQLENGKSNIRKIKKEAVDKLITEVIINQQEGTTEFPDLLTETDMSMIRNWWQKILSWFSSSYKKANISIFEEVGNKIMAGEVEGSLEGQTEIFYQVSDKQKPIQQALITTQQQLKKVESTESVDPMFLDTEEASNWYEIQNAEGVWERVKKRVTDRVKNWYKQRFPGKTFTEEEKVFNEYKRTLGLQGHAYFEEIHGRYFDNTTGERRTSVTPRATTLSIVDEQIYNQLENYYVSLIDKFSEGGKSPLVFAEVKLYDAKEKEAGTVDLMIIEESGKVNIIDWKFMSVYPGSTDVAWYKQGAYNIQLGRYKDILINRYGVKEVGMNRAIPIIMDFKRENPKVLSSKVKLTGIKIGSINPSEITNLNLMPVPEKTEKTSEKALDKLIEKLNAVLVQLGKTKASSDEEREFKSRRLNIIGEATRILHTTENLTPLIRVIEIMRQEGDMILNKYNTTYKNASASDEFVEKELSEFADDMREYNAIAKVFADIPVNLGRLIINDEMEKQAITDEAKADVAMRKKILTNIRKEAELIGQSRKEIKSANKKFADKFIGERNLVTGLLDPEVVLKGFSAYFNGISEQAPAAMQILYKIVTNAKGRASRIAVDEVKELMSIREKLSKRGGNFRELVQRIYQKDDKNKLVNKIIYRYSKEFFTTIDNNAMEGKRDMKVLKDSIDVEAYQKEALKHMEDNISYIETIHKNDPEKVTRMVAEEHSKWDLKDPEFDGWNNYIIKRHPLAKWYSNEFLELQKDPELLELYEFVVKMNDRAKSSGYIQNKIASIFLPFVRKSMAESLAWDFNISAIADWGDSLTINADDVGYGSINELTNELENSIPRYYANDFSRKEDGTNDYSDVSEDLFKNMILYINHMEKYNQFVEVEGQIQDVKTVESFKKHLNTSRTGDVIMKNGKPEVIGGNEENTKMLDDFIRGLFYEQKYPLSDSDTPIGINLKNFIKKMVNKVAGKEVWKVDENPSAVSLVKSMDMINRGFQLKTLGFEFISGAVNIFGGNIQMSTQAGQYFKSREFLKNELKLIGNKFRNDDEREMFIQLVEKFMPLKDDPNYEKLRQAGMTSLTRVNFADTLMVFMREPEYHLEKSVFLTLLENTMIEEGKIVNIREFVKNKYKDRYTSAEAYKEQSKQIESDIEELKRTRSIEAIKKLEEGKLVIPGLDMNNINELQRLTKLTRRISRNATGGTADSDLNRAGLNIWMKSMMVFKNWIPKLVATRFDHLRKVGDDFSTVIDNDGMTTGEKYDIGRIRLFFHVLWSKGMITGIRDIINILEVNDAGLKRIDQMYEQFAEEFLKRTGKELEMDRNDFIDLIRNNLRNQIKELAMLGSLLGATMAMGFMSPPDDADKATKNFYRWNQRIVDKFTSELLFFYNPAEFQKILSGGAFPAIGLLSDMERFISHLAMETTGMDITNPALTYDEVVKKAMPTKYLAKMLPITKSLLTYGAIFSTDFAKEFDITVPKGNTRR